MANINRTQERTNVLRTDQNKTGTLSFIPSSTLVKTLNYIPYKYSDYNLPKTTSAPLSFPLWITSIKQQNTLQGISGQSLKTKHFYPRSFGPGDYEVTCITKSQEDYQNLAGFIRKHHESIINGMPTPFDPNFIITGYPTLMTFSVPTEGISVQGWVSRFTLDKKGVFDPAPSYTFNFTIGFDSKTSAIDSWTSYAIKTWYSAGYNDIGVTDITDTNTLPPGALMTGINPPPSTGAPPPGVLGPQR